MKVTKASKKSIDVKALNPNYFIVAISMAGLPYILYRQNTEEYGGIAAGSANYPRSYSFIRDAVYGMLDDKDLWRSCPVPKKEN